jgi:hypothetical protein
MIGSDTPIYTKSNHIVKVNISLATKTHISFKNETLVIIWIAPSVMSGKYGLI